MELCLPSSGYCESLEVLFWVLHENFQILCCISIILPVHAIAHTGSSERPPLQVLHVIFLPACGLLFIILTVQSEGQGTPPCAVYLEVLQWSKQRKEVGGWVTAWRVDGGKSLPDTGQTVPCQSVSRSGWLSPDPQPGSHCVELEVWLLS